MLALLELGLPPKLTGLKPFLITLNLIFRYGISVSLEIRLITGKEENPCS